ncbi:SMP-30/gluconolactonase/LRE family protein [Streptomyces phaeochromogenes]|uniref:SMP-30/gluconolactonase/LRE family protein n=1 Tax=Streptomyces phaeochromogenes TaxID=1923 RepID=UPI002DD7A74B|nr:SMP-30/gluconolactonase/LRE family protein [Streptomyces phaeochromogenes]WRZ34170.1 SMP-30/gluconolactonase/LRE family protein [Streptomyces phaeochromogenes]
MTPRLSVTARTAGPGVLPPLRPIPLGGTGPEDVVVDREGRVITGVADGRVLRVRPRGPARVEQIARTGGRPLGLEVLPDGRLLVCDAERGLLRVTPEADVEVLVDRVAGEPLRFCSSVAAAADGTVYFTASSRRFGLQEWLGDLMERTATGRLLRLLPGGDEPEVLLDDLDFANGVVLAEDESWVAVAETGAYRLTRLWLTGPRTGQRDTLVENLPGFPGNLSRGTDGTVWVALAGPRQRPLDWLRRAPAGVRRAAWRAARPLPIRPRPVARVLGIGPGGRIRHDLRRRGAGYRMVTGVYEHDGMLILGSLLEKGIVVCELPGPV